jgi:transcriptional regulator with XRE-family HTH domain
MHKIGRCDIVFYDKYAQLCKGRGISMSAAAQAAGLSKSLVTKWKTNKVEVPSPDVLMKLSAYFNMPVSELLGEEEKEKPTAQGDGLTENQRILMEFAASVPDDKAEMILRVIRSIVEAD